MCYIVAPFLWTWCLGMGFGLIYLCEEVGLLKLNIEYNVLVMY